MCACVCSDACVNMPVEVREQPPIWFHLKNCSLCFVKWSFTGPRLAG